MVSFENEVTDRSNAMA